MSTNSDWRDIRNGVEIPSEGYCDQPYISVLDNGDWLCVMTTGSGREGDKGQHVVSSVSRDRGRTWSPLVDIEPPDGPEASWAMPLKTDFGRVYAFYVYNGDNITTLEGKEIRSDTHGWFCYRYTDDGGRTWSQRRRLPMRVTACDRRNQWGGELQLFWGIDSPIRMIPEEGAAPCGFFAFTKLSEYFLVDGEGFFYRSCNVLTERDPDKVEWELLPDGERGLRRDGFGSIQEEHNTLALEKPGHVYCVYRTTQGYPAHAYSRDGGRTWTTPEYVTWEPGGERRLKTPRACPKIWRTSEGRLLFWHHFNSTQSFGCRNPVWISGGYEKDGLVHWSQPEILLYDDDVSIRMSYPDLVEIDGEFWITETQKDVARIHRIDRSLLDGLWRQHEAAELVRDGLLLEVRDEGLREAERDMPTLRPLTERGGFSLALRFRLENLAPGQIMLDSRRENGQGIALETAENGTLRLLLSDGEHEGEWTTDAGLLESGKTHHVVFTADGGPRVITTLIDGMLCDGGEEREYGWGRFDAETADVTGGPRLEIGPTMQGQIFSLRIYGRPLRTSEAIANFRAERLDY